MSLVIFSFIFGYVNVYTNEIDCTNGCTGTYECNPNEDCHIICKSSNSCKHATFICSQNQNCYAECANSKTDDDSCLGTIFDGEFAKSFHLQVNTNEINNVWSLGTVKCPINGDCYIDCNGENTHGGICQHNQIYATNSKSLTINANGNWPIWNFDVYCPS